MRIIVPALSLLALVTSPALAHPDGHDEQYQAPQRKPVSQSAQEAVVKLVTQAKLPASWAGIQPSNVVDGSSHYLVTFENKAIRTRAKRMLYVRMTPSGEFISASHKKV